MENFQIALVSALVSGLLATIVTLWWQTKAKKKEMQRQIFYTLMAYRFRLPEYENVKALNSIQVAFYGNESVQQAWKSFKEETDRIPFNDKRIADAHIKLLEEIGKACGYKNIKWNEIKDSYYPTGLADEIIETERLRKANLQRAEMELTGQANTQPQG